MNSDPVQNEHQTKQLRTYRNAILKEMLAGIKMRPPERIRTWWNKRENKQKWKKREKREKEKKKKNASVTHASAQCLDIACDNNVLNAYQADSCTSYQRKIKKKQLSKKMSQRTEDRRADRNISFLVYHVRFDCAVVVVVGVSLVVLWPATPNIAQNYELFEKFTLVRALLRCDRRRHT